MPKLVIFAASFGTLTARDEQLLGSREQHWIIQLAQQLKLTPLIHSARGTSIDWIDRQFLKYCDTEYDPADVLVFLMPGYWRNPIVHEQVPENCAADLLNFVTDNATSTDSAEHYRKYAGFYKQLIEFTDEETNYYKYYSIVNRTYWMPNCCVHIPTSASLLEDVERMQTLQTDKNILIKENITEASVREYTDTAMHTHRPDFVDNKRSCHLSAENHSILAQQLAQVIETGNGVAFSNDKFKQGFL